MRLIRVPIFLIIFLPNLANGQNSKLDSLKSILAPAPGGNYGFAVADFDGDDIF